MYSLIMGKKPKWTEFLLKPGPPVFAYLVLMALLVAQVAVSQMAIQSLRTCRATTERLLKRVETIEGWPHESGQ